MSVAEMEGIYEGYKPAISNGCLVSWVVMLCCGAVDVEG